MSEDYKPPYQAEEFVDLAQIEDWINERAAEGYEVVSFTSGVWPGGNDGDPDAEVSAFYTALMKLMPVSADAIVGK